MVDKMSKRYAVSDLHGQLDLLNQIKEYVNDDDTVYVLGDAGDRGPEPWWTLKLCLDDPQFIYLMGNHDYMLIKSIEWMISYAAKYDDWNWKEEEPPFTWEGPISDLSYNGGLETLYQWMQESDRMKYYEQLRKLPIEITLSTMNSVAFIYLSHAGYTPGMARPLNTEDHVWDRTHFYQNWEYPRGSIVIHGHTPMQVLAEYLKEEEYEEKNGYLIYNNGAKIDIDRCAHVSEETVLLDLDTLEGKMFKVRGEE